MFLLIPESILKNVNLTATAKMVVSFIYHLSRAGKTFYGSADYLASALGLEPNNVLKALHGLAAAGVIYKNSAGYRCDLTEEQLELWCPNDATEQGVLAKNLVSQWVKCHVQSTIS